MNLRLLKIFIVVCQHMNMTKAAKELYISQPAVSQSIRQLEEHYQVILFERLANKLYLTQDGELLLSYAYHIVSQLEELENKLQAGQKVKQVNIGATITIGTYLMPRILADMKRHLPGMEIQVVVENTTYLEEHLLNAQLDLGLVEGQVTAKDLVVSPFMEDELMVICSKEHPLAYRDRLNVGDLSGQDFLLREETSGSRALFTGTMDRAGIPYRIAGVFNNTEAIIRSTEYNLGLGVVSKMAVTHGQPNVQALSIEGLDLKRNFSLVCHKNKFISGELGKVMNLVPRLVAQLESR